MPKLLKLGKWQRRCLIVFGCLALLFLVRVPVLRFAGWLLISADEDFRQADAIVILMGEPVARTEKALSLFRAGKAPRLVFVRPEDSPLMAFGFRTNDGEATLTLLYRAGVAPKDVTFVPGRVSSTHEEALAIRSWFDQQSPPLNKLIVVTSWYHTARAKWTVNRAMRGTDVKISMASATDMRFAHQNWWRDEHSFLLVFQEYVKWLYSFGRGWMW